MNNTKHTSGPWEISSIEPDAIIAKNYIYVATTHWVPNEAQDANARLIAAAPDLLESLRAMHDAVAMIVGNDSPVLQSAQSAIAKATGEKP